MKTALRQFFARRGAIPAACYLLTLAGWLVLGAWNFGSDAVARAGGTLTEQQLSLSSFQLVDLQGEGDGYVSTSGDPQIILEDVSDRVVRTLSYRAEFDAEPREMCLYYTTRADEPFSSGKRVFGQKQDDGSYLFRLPAGSIAALRLDPCSPAEEQGAITLTGLTLTLNVDAPWYAAFNPGWSGLFGYLVWPGLAAAAIRWLWDGVRFVRRRKQ